MIGRAQPPMGVYPFETSPRPSMNFIDAWLTKSGSTEPDMIPLVASVKVAWADVMHTINGAVDGSAAFFSHNKMLDLGVLVIVPNRRDTCPTMHRFVFVKIGHQ
jgi:hypothetical protein